MDNLENASEIGSDIDLEESWNQWSMRRREASDDGDGSSGGDDRDLRRNRRASSTGFDDDLDSAGRAPEEDDGWFFDDLDALSWETEEFARFGLGEEDRNQDQEEEKIQNDRLEAMEESKRGEEELKIKDKEALRVPTGPFYMHDDRFESGPSRQRFYSDRTKFGKLKDEKKWKHDKFEEIQEPKKKGFNARSKVQNKPIASHDSQIVPSRIVRGRGPAKYNPLYSNMPSTREETYGSVKLPEANFKPIESSSGSYLPKRHKKNLRCVNSNADQSPTCSNIDQVYPTTNSHALQQMSFGSTVHSGSEALFPSEAQHQFSYGKLGRTWMPRLQDNVRFPSPHHVQPNAYHRVLSQGQKSSIGISSSDADANKPSEGTSTPGAVTNADVDNQSRTRRLRYSAMKFNN